MLNFIFSALLSFDHYQAGFAPLFCGIVAALALTCFLKETGPAARNVQSSNNTPF